MKLTRIALFVLVAAMLLCTVGCAKTTEQEGALTVNGEAVQDVTVLFCREKREEYVTLPLLAVLEKIGCEIERNDAGQITVTPCGTAEATVFILDMQKQTMVTEDHPLNNILMPAPGATRYVCLFTESDVTVDDVTFKSVCFWMGLDITVDYDFDGKTISVECAQP